MSDIKIGKLANYSDERDAIHMPLIPVVAGENLKPGDPVYMKYGSARRTVRSNGNYVGVVDPFLTHDVEDGQWFWLLTKPGLVDKVRHDWETETFPKDNLLDDYDTCRGCY